MITSSDADQRSFAAATAAIAVGAGEIAFQFGKSGTIFYSRYVTLAVLGIVAFASTFVASDTERADRENTTVAALVRIGCLLPLAILAVFAFDDADSAIIPVLEVLALVAAPVVVVVLARIFGVDARSLPRNLQVLSAVTVIIAVGGSYLVGANHPTFFSCDQFETAGDNVPDDCFSEEGVDDESDADGDR